MTDEFKHGSVGEELTQTEWEAIGTHVFDSQSTGDILYASSATQLSRLAIGTTNYLLTVSSGIPAWTATPTITSLTTTSLTTSGLNLGTSSSPVSYTAGTPLVAIYATSSNTTSTNAEPFYLKSVMTGEGGYGGRSTFHALTNVALTTNFMALKAYAEFEASGSVSGLAAAFCAEMKMPAASGLAGGYFSLELEVVTPENSVTPSSAGGFMYMCASDDSTALASFNTNGVLFWLAGISDTNGGIFEAESNSDSMSMTHVLKIRIVDTLYYIALNTAKTF